MIQHLDSPAEKRAASGRVPGSAWAVLLLAAGAIALFHLATLRSGHSWGDDFAMYIAHARNLAEFRPYQQTGYVYNPFYAELGPRAYPPLFPLVLSVVYKARGIDLIWMKAVNVLALAGALLLLGLLALRELRIGAAVLVMLTFGLNPFVWNMKDSLMSEFLFILLLLAALLAHRRDDARWLRLSVLVLLCCATRTIGLLLVPCAVLYDLVRYRTLRAPALKFLAAAAAGLALYAASSGGESSYLDQMQGSLLAPLWFNLRAHAWQMYRLVWHNGYSTLVAALFCVGLGALGAAGYLRRLKQGPTLAEVFVPVYTGAILLWPTETDARLLIPVLPLWILYCYGTLSRMKTQRWTALAASLTFAGYLGAYSRADFGPLREGIGDPAFRRLCAYVETSLDPEAVLIFEKPRLLALLTGRRASGYQDPDVRHPLLPYFEQIGARYLVTADHSRRDRSVLAPLLAQHGDTIQELYRSGPFHLYRISKAPGPIRIRAAAAR